MRGKDLRTSRTGHVYILYLLIITVSLATVAMENHHRERSLELMQKYRRHPSADLVQLASQADPLNKEWSDEQERLICREYGWIRGEE